MADAPTLVITPQDKIHDGTPPGTSAVEAASNAARRILAEGKPLDPTTIAGQPRNTDGTFAPPAGQVAPAPKPGEVAPPAPVVPPKPVDGQPVVPPADETPEQKAAREAAEAAAAGEGAESAEEMAARELVERTITLVGRNNEEYDFVAPDKETAEVLRALRNGYQRGEEIRQAREQIETQLDDINNMRASIEMDPVGLVLEAAEGDPDVMEHLVMFLASQPENWVKLGPKLMKLADERERRTVAAEEKSRRFELMDQVAEESESRAAVRRNLEDVQSTVASLLPTEMSAEQQTVLYRDCLRDLKEYAERHRMNTIPVKDIAALLATRLTAYGINPVEAAARAAEVAARRGTTAPKRPAPTSPRVPAPAVAARPAAPAPTGKQLVLSAQKKVAAGALPPAGAGSPAGTAPMSPPKNPDGSSMTIEQRVAWHRGQVKKGTRQL